jgi:hypothetical protein
VSIQITTISCLPGVPAVYAMHGGKGRGLHVAYVGIADSLKARVEQHLVRRDSSVATGTSAVCLNPDYVTEVNGTVSIVTYEKIASCSARDARAVCRGALA